MKRLLSFLLITSIASASLFDEVQKTKDVPVVGIPTYGTMDDSIDFMPPPSTSAFSQGGYAFVPLPNGTYMPVPIGRTTSLPPQPSAPPLPLPEPQACSSIARHASPSAPLAPSWLSSNQKQDSVSLMNREDSVTDYGTQNGVRLSNEIDEQIIEAKNIIKKKNANCNKPLTCAICTIISTAIISVFFVFYSFGTPF